MAIVCSQAICQTQPVDLLTAERWHVVAPGTNDLRVQRVASVPLQSGHARGFTLTVARAADPFYAMQLVQDIREDLPAGERLRLTFWARSASRNPLRAVVEKAGPPYTAVAEWSGALTPAWKRYTAAGASSGFGPNGLSVRLQVGQAPGTLEFAGIALERLGPDPALALAQEAIRPEAIQERIRRYRMGDLQVVVRDARGRPIPGVKVRIEQTRHAFLFGCNIFLLEPANEEPAQKTYQERFAALFNYATLPFYWGAFEPQQGKPDYARLDAMAKWCIDHKITPKGHPLVWQEVWPAWAPSDPDEAIPLLRQRVLDLVGHYRGEIRYWDVVNEANGAANYPKTGQGQWVRRDGPAAVVATALQWARSAGSGDNVFIYNDYNTTDANVGLLSTLRDRKALPDAIGIQSHMHGQPWPLEQVWATADRFAQFHRPIHFTETTVVSGPPRNVDMQHPPADWVTTDEGEKRQADYVAGFYSVLFSHPSVRAITYWDFSDRGAWLNAPAGFLRKDMSSKPAYDRLMDLIHRQWWSKVSAATDRAGACKAHVFYGDYHVTATDSKGHSMKTSVSFPMGAASSVTRLVIR